MVDAAGKGILVHGWNRLKCHMGFKSLEGFHQENGPMHVSDLCFYSSNFLYSRPICLLG